MLPDGPHWLLGSRLMQLLFLHATFFPCCDLRVSAHREGMTRQVEMLQQKMEFLFSI